MKIFSKLMLGSKKKVVISSIGVLALIVFAGVVLLEATKAKVVFAEDGKEQTIRTHKDTVSELLQELDVEVSENDLLSHHEDEMIKNGMTINYEKAKEVKVTINGDEHTYSTTADTVDAFLEEQNLSLADHDEISLSRDEALKDGLEFEIKEAFKVTVNDGGKEKTVWTTGGTVKDLLAEEEISYDKSSDDKIKPELDKELTKDTEIEIIRVEKSTDEVTVKVPFDIEKEEDSSLAKGKEKVLTPGEEGTVVKKYEVTLENGEEVNRELVSEDITEESENQIVAVGTKAPELEAEASASTNTDHNNSDSNSNAGSKTDVETDANNESSGKTITVTASAYTASCSGCSGKTATGIDLSANPNQKVIAVDPNVIPLGSKVHVEGYGEAIAADTGGGITGNRIDVHVPTKEAAYNWGKRSVQVKVLD